MREWQTITLGLDRRHHFAIGVPEARHGGAARRIQVALAVAVDEIGAIPAYSDGIVGVRIAMKNVANFLASRW